MAIDNEKLQHMLNLSKKIDNGTKQTVKRTKPNPAILSKSIDEIDKQFFGKLEENNDGQPVYDADKDLDRLKKINSGEIKPDLERSRLPKAILESFRQEPLNFNPSMVEDPRMKELEQKLSAKNGKSENTFENIAAIQEKLDRLDKQKAELNESLSPRVENVASGVPIDYSMIKMIVEKVIDEKLNTLNESISSNPLQSLNCMTIKNGGFLFLTENGDIYECKMTYKGTNRKKK